MAGAPTPDRDYWTTYWREGNGRSCVPDDHGIRACLKGCWGHFASPLAKGARVLDLATGSGDVLRHIAQVRPDLDLVGVDSSAWLPDAGPGITLFRSVRLEALPFDDSSIDAVCSQFGFEYADRAAAAAQIARVLRPGSPLRMVVHRSDGPILAHNLARAEAIRWGTDRSPYFDDALAFAEMASGPVHIPADLRLAPQIANDLHPGQPAAELLIALGQHLEGLPRLGRAATMAAIDNLRQRARGEAAMIDALSTAACDATQIDALVETLSDAGLTMERPVALAEQQTGMDFAWLVQGRR